MGLTAAERQRRYVQRHLKDGTESRVSLVLSSSAHAALARLAKHRGVSRRALIESLLADAERQVLEASADAGGYLDALLR